MDIEKLVFDLTKKGLQIDNSLFSFPIKIEQLAIILGQPTFYKNDKPEGNHIYTWDDLGIYAFSENAETTHCVTVFFKKEFEWECYPKKIFRSILKINNQDFETYYASIEETLEPWPSSASKKIGQHKTYFTIDDERTLCNIQFIMPDIKIKKVPNEKYMFHKIEGEKIKFTDFNFKLAVIQVLMYKKEILQPKFDLEEFTKLYHKREIDLENEGYDFIPEVTNYFKKLEIDKKYAPEITELCQDGGDDIYLNLICFWDGEDNVFNIQSAKDAEQFPNLKKVTLFGNPSEKTVNGFKKIGIVVD